MDIALIYPIVAYCGVVHTRTLRKVVMQLSEIVYFKLQES